MKDILFTFSYIALELIQQDLPRKIRLLSQFTSQLLFQHTNRRCQTLQHLSDRLLLLLSLCNHFSRSEQSPLERLDLGVLLLDFHFQIVIIVIEVPINIVQSLEGILQYPILTPNTLLNADQPIFVADPERPI